MYRVLPVHASIENGRLSVGGCDAAELAQRFGTPLYVYDEAGLEDACRSLAEAIARGPAGSRALYALKAFPSVAMARIAHDVGLGLLCASAGEMAVAAAAGVPADDRVLHGNNKSDDDLESGAGRVVVDSHDEIDRLERLGIAAKCWLRVAPGLEAGGHHFIRTGALDSKFGVGIGEAQAAAKRLAALPDVELVGLHAHIGSHWFGAEEQVELARLMVPFLREVADATGAPLRELDLGGGFAIAYTRDDPDIVGPAEAAAQILRDWPDDLALVLEPGRSLVGRAGVSLHTVGTVKEVPGVRTYVAIDGGMSDNIRHALYGARFEFILADKADAPADLPVRIVGKHCESGDVVGDDVPLPADVRVGDVLVTAATGAYCWAMASNYNQLPRPAIVFCRDGEARVVVEREGIDDLLRLHHP